MKNILITGASSGIGEATVKYLASTGEYALMLIGRNEDKIKKLCMELGPSVYYYCYDLHNLESIENIFLYCKDNNFILNGLVYCAGIAGNLPIRSLDLGDAKTMMDINCMAFVEMAKYATNRKYSDSGCSIVAISSLSSLTGYPGTAAYTMSKNALNAVCKVLSKEVLRRGIRVNTVMPAYVRTPMMAYTKEEDILSEQPLGYIEPSEVGYLIEFLLSDKSKHLTGASIPISAGMNF